MRSLQDERNRRTRLTALRVRRVWDKVQVNGELVDAAMILTTTPRGLTAEVHDRMPVILPRDAWAKWIDPEARYRDLLEPDADGLRARAGFEGRQ